MTAYLVIFAVLYLLGLSYCAILGAPTRRSEAGSFSVGGGQIGPFVGVLTTAATLFSTFTLMGIPDFFRVHGIATWIFLGVTDVALALVALLFGHLLRTRINRDRHKRVSDFLADASRNRWVGYLYLFASFIFLVPYVAIQIRGVAILAESVVPFHVSATVWTLIVVGVMLTYSVVGGLRAVVLSDAIQGTLLLVVVWVVMITCWVKMGGLSEAYRTLARTSPALLSAPGPKGLLDWKFLVSSFIFIALMPVTQPQLTARLLMVRSSRALRRMAIWVAVFAVAVIIPTVVIGAFGSVFYASASLPAFLSGVYVDQQIPAVAALALLGIFAAAMSTADSQIHTLATEMQHLRPSSGRLAHDGTLLLFTAAAAALALVGGEHIVLLARVSFAGTSLVAPLVLAVVLRPQSVGVEVPAISFAALIAFLLSLGGLTPKEFLGIPFDLAILIVTAISVSAAVLYRSRLPPGAPAGVFTQ